MNLSGNPTRLPAVSGGTWSIWQVHQQISGFPEPWDCSSAGSAVWRLAVTHFWHVTVLTSRCDCISLPPLSLSQKHIVAWRWAREDRELQRQGRAVELFTDASAAPFPPSEILFFFCHTARMAADEGPQYHTWIFIRLAAWHLIRRHGPTPEQI